MILNEQDLKSCFSLFATGVMVAATSDSQGKNQGLTINSFSSVSLSPPLLLFSIGNSSHNLDIFKNSQSYSLNIMAKNQLDLALEFAKPNNDKKWLTEEYQLTKNNNPIFKNSLGFFECIHHKIVEAGDHHVFIGEIIDCAVLNDDEALLYCKSKFI